jgi:hypothetical protein
VEEVGEEVGSASCARVAAVVSSACCCAAERSCLAKPLITLPAKLASTPACCSGGGDSGAVQDDDDNAVGCACDGAGPPRCEGSRKAANGECPATPHRRHMRRPRWLLSTSQAASRPAAASHRLFSLEKASKHLDGRRALGIDR